MRRSISEWIRIVSDIEETSEYYDRVNELISLGYGDRLRHAVVEDVGRRDNILDAGAGPGSLSKKILGNNPNAYVIDLDASYNLLSKALDSLTPYLDRVDFVVGIFESPPFREGSLDAVYAAYALRDAIEIDKALSKLSSLLRNGGVLIDIDIGKPDNILMRTLLRIYMYTVVPILASIVYRRFNNPWWGLGRTLNKLPLNSEMIRLFKKIFKRIEVKYYAFSTLYVLKGYR